MENFMPKAMFDVNHKIVRTIIQHTGTELSTILDIGANIGTMSISFSKLIDKKCTIHAFEPIVETFEMLRENIAQNNIINIKAHNFGFYSAETELKLGITKIRRHINSGLYSVFNGENGDFVKTGKFKKLSKWVKENEITKIELIKLDVEGCECVIIDEAHEVFKNTKFLLVEFNPTYDCLKLEEIISSLKFEFVFNASKFDKLFVNTAFACNV